MRQNVSEQVAGYMRDPNRMIKRMQLRRSSVGIFGKVSFLISKIMHIILFSLFVQFLMTASNMYDSLQVPVEFESRKEEVSTDPKSRSMHLFFVILMFSMRLGSFC